MAGTVKFGNNTDHQYNQALNMLAQSRTLSTAGLTSSHAGLFAYSGGRLYVLNATGSAFELVATDSDKLGGQNSAFHLDRANHTGQQAASTISGLTAAVTSAISPNDLALMDGPLNANSQKITSLASGTAGTDAVNKGQLDAVAAIADAAAQGVAIKRAVRAVATTNITLSGPQTIDGVSLVANDRVLVAGQSSASANGIYVVQAAAWVRATDADSGSELAPGTQVAVTEGVTSGPASAGGNADSIWRLTSDAAITIGTTPQTWERLPGASANTYIAGAGLTLSTSTFDVGAGTGILVNADNIQINPAVVARVARGTIPSGGSASVNIVHGLALGANQHIGNLIVVDRASGDEVDFGWTSVDGNTVSIVLPAAPTANQWDWTVIG